MSNLSNIKTEINTITKYKNVFNKYEKDTSQVSRFLPCSPKAVGR